MQVPSSQERASKNFERTLLDSTQEKAEWKQNALRVRVEYSFLGVMS